MYILYVVTLSGEPASAVCSEVTLQAYAGVLTQLRRHLRTTKELQKLMYIAG